MGISRNKILLLILSSVATINNIVRYLPSIINELIIFGLVISFTAEYRKILKGFYLKFADSLPFNSVIFFYAVLAILYPKIRIEGDFFIWSVFLIVVSPAIFLCIYGIKYFDKNHGELREFYKNFYSDRDYKKFWHDYNTTRGAIRKINKIMVVYAIPGLVAGISIVVLFLVLLLLIFADYLFLIVTFVMILSDYLAKKRLIISDSIQKSFEFLRDLIDIKGAFGSFLIIMGYFSLGILIVSYVNALPTILFDEGLSLISKAMMLILYLPIFTTLIYMFLYQYKLSRRFLKFIQVIYNRKDDMEKMSCSSLPYGEDKVFAFSFIIFLILIFYMKFLWGALWRNSYLLGLAVIASIALSVFYMVMILSSISHGKKYISLNDLKRDNLRLPLASFMSSFIFSLQNELFGQNYDWYLYFYLIFSIIFLFFVKDLWGKIEKLHLNKYAEETIPFLFYFAIVAFPIFIPSLQQLYIFFIAIEIFIAIAWAIVIINKIHQ